MAMLPYCIGKSGWKSVLLKDVVLRVYPKKNLNYTWKWVENILPKID